MTRKPVHRNKFLLPALLLLILAGWLGKAWIGASSPEESATMHVRNMDASNFHLYVDSVEAMQKAELNNLSLVLVRYAGTRPGGGAEVCTCVVETENVRFLRWEAHTSSGSCYKVDESAEALPITVSGSYGGSSAGDPGYTAVYGIIRDPQITRVVVTWEDGQAQSADVHGSAYLAAREGRLESKMIEAFNSQNKTVYATD